MDDYVVGPKRQRRISEILTLVGIIALQHYVETASIPSSLQIYAPFWEHFSTLHKTDPALWMLFIQVLAFHLPQGEYIVGNQNGVQGLFIMTTKTVL
jgi:hypothetical protein